MQQNPIVFKRHPAVNRTPKINGGLNNKTLLSYKPDQWKAGGDIKAEKVHEESHETNNVLEKYRPVF